MDENDHGKILEDLQNFILETKILVEKVMKMRIQCKDSQLAMLRLFNPECIKVLQISDELSAENLKPMVRNEKTSVQRMNVKEPDTVTMEED